MLYGFTDNFQSWKYRILFFYLLMKLIFGNTIKKLMDILDTLQRTDGVLDPLLSNSRRAPILVWLP